MFNEHVVTDPEGPHLLDGFLVDSSHYSFEFKHSTINRLETLLPDVKSPLLRLSTVLEDDGYELLSSVAL